jgi:lysophospholipase L1-like esterase
VIEEGLGGRTTVFDDPLSEHRNGKSYFQPCLESHQPLDVVIIMLGTNDVQTRFAASAVEIAWGMELLAVMAKAFAPVVLVIAPSNLARIPDIEEGAYHEAAEKMRQLPSLYRDIAHANGCLFLDASQVIVSSDVDGIHFDAAEHRKLGEAVAEVIQDL